MDLGTEIISAEKGGQQLLLTSPNSQTLTRTKTRARHRDRHRRIKTSLKPCTRRSLSKDTTTVSRTRKVVVVNIAEMREKAEEKEGMRASKLKVENRDNNSSMGEEETEEAEVREEPEEAGVDVSRTEMT